MALELRASSVVLVGQDGLLRRALVRVLHMRRIRVVAVTQVFDCRVWAEYVAIRRLAVSRPDVVIRIVPQHGDLMVAAAEMDAAFELGSRKFVTVGAVAFDSPSGDGSIRRHITEESARDTAFECYSDATRALVAQGHTFQREQGFKAICTVPVNPFGPGEAVDPGRRHSIGALVKKCIEARDQDLSSIEFRESGADTGQFLYVDDAVDGILLAAERCDSPEPVALGSGFEMPLRAAVGLILEATGYRGTVTWDTAMPGGQPRSSFDTSRALELFGFRARVDFREGLRRTVEWYERSTAGSRRRLQEVPL